MALNKEKLTYTIEDNHAIVHNRGGIPFKKIYIFRIIGALETFITIPAASKVFLNYFGANSLLKIFLSVLVGFMAAFLITCVSALLVKGHMKEKYGEFEYKSIELNKSFSKTLLHKVEEDSKNEIARLLLELDENPTASIVHKIEKLVKELSN